MYCPRCAAQNIDDASYCRACGADIRLVPQAMAGHPIEPPTRAEDKMEPYSSHGMSRRQRRKGEPSLESGIRNVFVGIGFMFVAVMIARFAPAGQLWWFWMLIPAFSMLGGGIAEIVRVRQKPPPPSVPGRTPPAIPETPTSRLNELPRRNTGELMPPASVTENTTRRLGAQPVARPVGTAAERSDKS